MADDAIGKAIYFIPFLPNPSFVRGRAEIELLKQALMVNRTCYKTSIVGLRGNRQDTGGATVCVHSEGELARCINFLVTCTEYGEL